MKPHVLIKLRRPVAGGALPYWEDVIDRADLRTERFTPDVDRLFDGERLAFIATSEYRPATDAWSPAETAAGLDRVYRLVLQRAAKVPTSLIEAIRLLPQVEAARAGVIGQMELEPASAALSRLAGEDAREAIFLDEAHAFSKGDPEITIAVLDTGLDLAHPEYAKNLLPGRDFVNILSDAEEFIGDYVKADDEPRDEVGHGSHVAGITVGRGLKMPAGVAPRCRVLPVRVLAAMRRERQAVGAGLVDNINAGVKWAVDNGADVINMSLGVRHSQGGLPHQEVIEYANLKGVTVVAASGNDGRHELYYPAALPSVIAVGAVDREGAVAPFSTYGRHVSFVAPGVDVYSTYLDGGYAFSSGTSHAAPFVTGAIALLKSYARAQGQSLSDRQVKHVLKHTTDKIDGGFRNDQAGYGRLNLADALRYLDYKLNTPRRPHVIH